MHAAGARLIVIGSGRPEHARRFVDEEKLESVTVVTDPSLHTYSLAGMKRGVFSTIGPRAALHALRALRAGHMQHATAGDPWQQGGVIVVSSLSSGGRELLHHESSTAGEPTDFAVILRALAS
jgi:hypothetical protein